MGTENIKTKHGIKLPVLCVYYYFKLAVCNDVSCVKKSMLEVKVDALDSLVRDELYSLKETIRTDRQERKELVKKLNKILEFLEMSTGETADKLKVDTYNGGIQEELQTLSENMEQNNKADSQLAESQLHKKEV